MTDKKKDCPLACGYEAIDRSRYWWQRDGEDMVTKAWLIFSTPLLAVLIWGQKSGWLDVNGLWLAPLGALYIIGIVGFVFDIVMLGLITKDVFNIYIMPKISREASLAGKLFEKTLKFLFTGGSPVYAVWLAAARQAGELASYSSDARLGLYIVAIVAAIGCLYDLNWLLGADVKRIWKNQNKNVIGCFKRLFVRAIGYAYIAAGKCDIVKKSAR